MGNLVGSATSPGRIEIYMIDFEKSRSLGDNPFLASGSVDPKRFWPTAELGALLKPIRPPRCPHSILDRIRSLAVERIAEAIRTVAAELPFIT